ncbi:RNA-guided endonuclease InsQ/TnpB family protein [Dictyobacter formicarum]|uniref:Transposase n=1 Tax=Dictyobacter formicarum TaxID=2778368 RepID=A0ABQ3VS45_9CHLR|nr:RNA-guided endonuclease TnpB family protein [Dictyobacter formicarum]GHO88635.1 transposase [Dictyobacter formicarum]
MKMTRGYRTELDLNNAQKTTCLQHAGAARWAYNWGLKRYQEEYQAGRKTPNAKELNALKQTKLSWMYEVSKCAPQEALRNLEKAFKNFFGKTKLKKQGKYRGKLGYPRFKSKKKGIGSFRLTGTIHVFEDRIQLPRIGIVQLHERGYLPTAAKILSATVSEQAGRWFVSVQVEESIPEPQEATGTVIGVDLGVKALATVSNGITIANPKALRSNLKKLRRASRQHSRKQKGSKNRTKATRKLARLHAHIANIRKDTLHKATSQLVMKTKSPNKKPSVIVLEDLNVSGMLKNRHLSRAIADVGFYEFRRQIEYKAQQSGVQVKFVSRWEPSSKTCSSCKVVREELDVSERVFVCHVCGLVIDRDLNASYNLADLA